MNARMAFRLGPGSTGCQPVPFGSLPNGGYTTPALVCARETCFRQAAGNHRLAACTPRNRRRASAEIATP